MIPYPSLPGRFFFPQWAYSKRHTALIVMHDFDSHRILYERILLLFMYIYIFKQRASTWYKMERPGPRRYAAKFIPFSGPGMYKKMEIVTKKSLFCQTDKYLWDSVHNYPVLCLEDMEPIDAKARRVRANAGRREFLWKPKQLRLWIIEHKGNTLLLCTSSLFRKDDVLVFHLRILIF